jgi:2-polyprenyl-3-methyl-5-hydroxy-6-metoxy-1,4-benzoquinol methylase
MQTTLDATEKQTVAYCIPLWLRDEQIKHAIARVPGRIAPAYDARPESVAVVCYGPSLNETWEQVRDFPVIISCSGAHKFLLERGIVPTYHVEVDPRAHKTLLMGPPHPDVEYLIASTCHPKLFDHLAGQRVTLWHVFDSKEEGIRTLPHGEWAITGGCNVGLRALTLAGFLGFRDLHVFGMDGCEGASGKHAAAHPNQPTGSAACEYPPGSGTVYRTTPAMLEAARGTWHELDQMPAVRATFYGEGLVQAMARDYVPKPKSGTTVMAAGVGFCKDPVISAEYASLNRQLHESNLAYGVGGGKHAETVLSLAASLKTTSILDYGCGKGYLAKAIPFPIWEYDPAIPGKTDSPRPADVVVCTDVLEHIEPEHLDGVLKDLQRCTRKVGYFVIHTGPAAKTLPDGRNTHLLQYPRSWWEQRLRQHFTVGRIIERLPEIHVVVGPKQVKVKKKAP